MSLITLRDGRAGISINELIVSNLNNGFEYYSDGNTLTENVISKKVTDPTGRTLGGESYSMGFTGSLNVAYKKVVHSEITDQHCIRPYHFLMYRGNYYYPTGNITGDNKAGEAINAKVEVSQVVNPIITSLLSWEGQFVKATGSAGATITKTNTVANVPTGYTVAWSLEGAPSGMTINSSTGAISYPSAVAGSYTVTVVATASKADEDDLEGVAEYHLTVS